MFGRKKKENKDSDERQQERGNLAGNELSDDELEMVVGGISNPDVVVILKRRLNKIGNNF